jgi:hypothetical protein
MHMGWSVPHPSHSWAYHSSIQLHHHCCLAPLKHTSNLLWTVVSYQVPIKWMKHQLLTCKMFIYKMWYNTKTQLNGWNIGCLTCTPSIHKSQPIGWINISCLTCNLAIYKSVWPPWPYQFPHLILATPVLYGSDEHNEYYRTHWVIVIAMMIVMETLFVTSNQF